MAKQYPHRVAVYLDTINYQLLKQIAAAEQMSLSDLGRAIIIEYVTLTDEKLGSKVRAVRTLRRDVEQHLRGFAAALAEATGNILATGQEVARQVTQVVTLLQRCSQQLEQLTAQQAQLRQEVQQLRFEQEQLEMVLDDWGAKLVYLEIYGVPRLNREGKGKLIADLISGAHEDAAGATSLAAQCRVQRRS